MSVAIAACVAVACGSSGSSSGDGRDGGTQQDGGGTTPGTCGSVHGWLAGQVALSTDADTLSIPLIATNGSAFGVAWMVSHAKGPMLHVMVLDASGAKTGTFDVERSRGTATASGSRGSKGARSSR